MPVDELQNVEYKFIDGFPGYAVGSDGSVWSNHMCSWAGREDSPPLALGPGWRRLIGGRDRDGYHKLILCHARQRRHTKVHILVLEAFVGPRPQRMTAAHLDGNKNNNSASNLAWKTQKDNIHDKRLHGTWQGGSSHPRSFLNEEKVRSMRAERAAGLPLRILAERYGVKMATVSAVCARRLWRHVP